MVTLNHIGIVTAHPRRLFNFYSNKLGFEKSQETVLPEDIVYSIFKIPQPCTMAKLTKDGTCLEVFWFKNYRLKPRAKETAGYNHFGMEIKDREEFLTGLRREYHLKVTTIKRGDHYNYFIQDPDKNIIEIKELSASK